MSEGPVATLGAIAETNGKPTSVTKGERGFRIYTWTTPSKTITLTAYPAGVIVTEAKVADEGHPASEETPPAASP